jgi:hypothetical protein
MSMNGSLNQPDDSPEGDLNREFCSSGFDQPGAFSYTASALPTQFELFTEQAPPGTPSLNLPPGMEALQVEYNQPEEISFQAEMPAEEIPWHKRSSIPMEDDAWVPHFGYSPPPHEEEHGQESNFRPYNQPLHSHRSAIRSNPLGIRLGTHFMLPEDRYCPLCHMRLNYEGRCDEPSCPNWGQVVNEEMHDNYEKESEEVNMDVMKRWEEELNR